MKTIKVRIISDYQNQTVDSWLKQQSTNGDQTFYGSQANVFFTTQTGYNDYVLMINKVNIDTPICCPPNKIFAIQQEPYIPSNPFFGIPFKNEFAKKPSTYAQCEKVFAFVPELLCQNQKFIPSPPYLYWLIEGGNRKLTFQDIANLDILKKSKEISCIANLDKKAFAGHLKRTQCVQYLKNSSLPIDFFGGEKKHNTIRTKLEALQEYRYSIAIENSSTPFYFTEKITDYFLAGCMPFYYGAENIDKFFPKDSYVWIDINNRQETEKIIASTLKDRKWEKNLDAILEARRLCLEEYNFIQAIGKIIQDDYISTSSPITQEIIIIKKYKRSFKDHIRRNLERMLFKFYKIKIIFTRSKN